ncbi:MAG: hypothetical protein JNM71_12665 [Flavobacterium lindanitolerans]|uniref:hypothetical protein n=1 Tax=Flavobacterium lindanitolerans TaxID=428988 RepID=UPI001A5F6F77|nr:hypothetical protein [Flavobacterium lindanitolerans]MBL7868859.1 hypothetical protein [Flavobacterium lindanitolerans]
MTSENYVNENKTDLFKKGDKVIMHSCYEATCEEYRDKVWICQTDSFLAKDKSEVVFLEGFSGYFNASCLKLKNEENKLSEKEERELLEEVGFQRYQLLKMINLVKRPDLAITISVAGLEIGLCDNDKVKEMLLNEVEECNKCIRRQPNKYE